MRSTDFEDTVPSEGTFKPKFIGMVHSLARQIQVQAPMCFDVRCAHMAVPEGTPVLPIGTVTKMSKQKVAKFVRDIAEINAKNKGKNLSAVLKPGKQQTHKIHTPDVGNSGYTPEVKRVEGLHPAGNDRLEFLHAKEVIENFKVYYNVLNLQIERAERNRILKGTLDDLRRLRAIVVNSKRLHQSGGEYRIRYGCQDNYTPDGTKFQRSNTEKGDPIPKFDRDDPMARLQDAFALQTLVLRLKVVKQLFSITEGNQYSLSGFGSDDIGELPVLPDDVLIPFKPRIGSKSKELVSSLGTTRLTNAEKLNTAFILQTSLYDTNVEQNIERIQSIEE